MELADEAVKSGDGISLQIIIGWMAVKFLSEGKDKYGALFSHFGSALATHGFDFSSPGKSVKRHQAGAIIKDLIGEQIV